MEANEIVTLIKFFKNSDNNDGIFDLTNDEFVMITIRSIRRDLINEYTSTTHGVLFNPGMVYCLTKFAQTADDEDFYKLSYELMKYYIINKERINNTLHRTRKEEEINACLSILVKYISPTYIYYRNIQETNLQERFDKINERIMKGDYDGAITSSRTLVEAFLKECLQLGIKNSIYNPDQTINKTHDIKNLIKAVFTCYNLLPKSLYSEPWKGLAGCINNLIIALAAVRNAFGDSHANNEKSYLKKHHAELAANAAFTLVVFISAVVNNKLKTPSKSARSPLLLN